MKKLSLFFAVIILISACAKQNFQPTAVNQQTILELKTGKVTHIALHAPKAPRAPKIKPNNPQVINSIANLIIIRSIDPYFGYNVLTFTLAYPGKFSVSMDNGSGLPWNMWVDGYGEIFEPNYFDFAYNTTDSVNYFGRIRYDSQACSQLINSTWNTTGNTRNVPLTGKQVTIFYLDSTGVASADTTITL